MGCSKALLVSQQSPSEYSQLRAIAIWGLARYLSLLDTGQLILTELEAQAAYDAAYLHLDAYQKLTFLAHARGSSLYRTRPKWHYFAHSVDYLYKSRENPRFFHTFRGEDFVGKACKIAGMVHRTAMMRRTLQRYSLKLAQHFEESRAGS